jgi:homoserine kinase
MTLRSVSVYAPATIANLGPGFDVLGLAIDAPGDIVIATLREEPGLGFSASGPVMTPVNHTNVAAHVAQLLLDDRKPRLGVSLVLKKHMPIGSGLGSSGASAVASVVAVNALLEKPLTRQELLPFAMEGERLAAGSAHADNVAPALLGGLCLVRSYQPLDVIQLPVKNNFFWIVAHPDTIIETQQARDLLPASVPLPQLVQQTGNLAGLITSLSLGDAKLLQRSLQDVIIEPLRAELIPGFSAVKQAALQAGALAFSIAGSGPTVFAVATTEDIATQVATAMQQAFLKNAKLSTATHISRLNLDGAKLLDNPP